MEESSFETILFPSHGAGGAGDGDGVGHDRDPAQPGYFRDLHLDRIAATATASRPDGQLGVHFSRRLHDADHITYRQEVFADLDRPAVRRAVQRFCDAMGEVRADRDRARDRRFPQEQQRWLLDAAVRYCAAVRELSDGLGSAGATARGFRALARFLERLLASAAYLELEADAARVAAALAAVRYRVHLRGLHVTVSSDDDGVDYSAAVLATFERFAQAPTDARAEERDASTQMDHVEARIVELVARLPGQASDALQALREFCVDHRDFVDPTVERFDREVQFYLAYLELVAPLRAIGLPFCTPEVGAGISDVHACEAFDLALATKLVPEGTEVVRNGFSLAGAERIIVVSGPNQGGKTTFARMVGQLHHLAAIGCPVPGTQARLRIVDQLFTHFQHEDALAHDRGTLEDDVVRMQEILAAATSQSLVITNEPFAATTLEDARFLGRTTIERMTEIGLWCVYVTFVDELSSLNHATVSMVSTVVPENPTARTFQVVRRPADGRAFAVAIAEKYGLTYPQLRRRLSA